MKKTADSYAVTRMRNSQTQCRRGELRGYAVTNPPIHMCARVRVRACARTHVCVRDS